MQLPPLNIKTTIYLDSNAFPAQCKQQLFHLKIATGYRLYFRRALPVTRNYCKEITVYYCDELRVTIPLRCVLPDMQYIDRKKNNYGSLSLLKTSYTVNCLLPRKIHQLERELDVPLE